MIALARHAGAIAAVCAVTLLAACGKPADNGATSTAAAPQGTTGSSTAGAMPQPGSGLSGGLATGASAAGSLPAGTPTSSAPSGMAPGTDGSTNSTPKSSVGN